MKTNRTNVYFLVDESGEVFAFFPDEYYNLDLDPDLRTCYAHIGQHSACSLEYTKTCRNATDAEFTLLYDELTDIGYDIRYRKLI